MTYTALYRKYRPSTFDDVAGQRHIVQTLTNALVQNRLTHAYLFAGPSGNGKTSVAKLFAKAVNCESETEIICDKCSNCLDTKNNVHPDVVEIDAASNNGVDEIRNLIEKVKYSPLKGKYKVYIIDEVHMLSIGAFNALLKTLEEPPKHVIFILATTEPHKVIPTIISRCQRYDFSKVLKKDIYNNIEKILINEKIAFEDSAIYLISDLADGGVRNSLSILEQSVAYSIDKLLESDVRRIYGIATKQDKFNLLKAIINLNVEETLQLLDAIVNQGNDLERFNIDIINILKEALIFSYTKSEDLLEKINLNDVNYIIDHINQNQLIQMIDVLMEIDGKKKNISDVISYLQLGYLKLIEIATNKITTSYPQNKIKAVDNSKEASKNLEVKPEVIKSTKKTEKAVKPEIREVKVESETKEKIVREVVKVKKEANKKEIEQLLDEKAEIVSYQKDQLLSLLTFANKQKRLEIDNQWQKMEQLMTDFQYAKYANYLNNSRILAVGDNYMVVVCKHNHLSGEINKPINFKGLTNLIKDHFDIDGRVIGLSEEAANDLIKYFKEKAAKDDLPKAIDLSFLKEEKVKKTENIFEKANKIFGENNFVIKE